MAADELPHEKPIHLAPMDGLLAKEQAPQKLMTRVWEVLTPDILSRRKGPVKRLGTTAWLDGLRGWAALVVAFMHLTVYTHEGLELCYGQKFKHNDSHNTSWTALPIIRLPFTGGHFSVMLFFVISGYVVPRRLTSLLNEGRQEEFMEALHSSMVRRPVRLFLPVILSTGFLMLFWHISGITIPWPILKVTIFHEIWNWIQDISVFLYFFKVGYLYTYYNVHTWTIPVEFRGSMFLFVFLLVVSNVSIRTRVFMTIGVMLHLSLGSPGASYACFFGGMLLSDLEMLADSGITFPWDPIDKFLRQKGNKLLRIVVLHLLLAGSLYLATQPSSDWSTREETMGDCPGWITLGHMIPRVYLDDSSQFRWFWLFWAAWIMVYCVREIGWLRRCFETKTAQYLGKHSFALYLVHGPLIGLWAERLFYLTGLKVPWTDEQIEMFGSYQNKWVDSGYWPFPKTGGTYGLEPSFLVCVVLTLPVMLYCAEVATRLCDEPSVTASRWVWQKWKKL